jgi:hypothetical protein
VMNTCVCVVLTTLPQLFPTSTQLITIHAELIVKYGGTAESEVGRVVVKLRALFHDKISGLTYCALTRATTWLLVQSI